MKTRRPSPIQRWAVFAVAILIVHVGAMATAVTIIVKHGNAAVIPNYYEKAVRFDELKAARAPAAASTQESAR